MDQREATRNFVSAKKTKMANQASPRKIRCTDWGEFVDYQCGLPASELTSLQDRMKLRGFEASRDLIKSNNCRIFIEFSNSYLLPLGVDVSVKIFRGIDLKSNSLA